MISCFIKIGTISQIKKILSLYIHSLFKKKNIITIHQQKKSDKTAQIKKYLSLYCKKVSQNSSVSYKRP